MVYLIDSCNSLNNLQFGSCLFWPYVVRMPLTYLTYPVILTCWYYCVYLCVTYAINMFKLLLLMQGRL
jgi:hypothetical protein